jgi:DedD protein
MWVAREAIGPVVGSTPVEGAPATEPGDRLEFFGENSTATGAETNVDEPTIQQVKALPTPAPDNPRAAAPAGTDGATPEVRARDTDRRDPVAQRAPEVPAEPQSSAAQSTVSSAPVASPSDAAPGAGFVIQVFSSNDETQANALLARLKDSGYSAFRRAEEVNGRTMYRVRVGPYPERSTAESEATKLKRQFKVDTWITSSG